MSEIMSLSVQTLDQRYERTVANLQSYLEVMRYPDVRAVGEPSVVS